MTEQTLWEPPKVEIENETYKLRRLGLIDLKRVPEIIKKALDEGMNEEVLEQVATGESGTDEENVDNEEAGKQVLLEALPFVTEELTKWLVDIVKDYEVDDINDPDELPLPVVMELFNALGEHQDFEKFFTKVGKSVEIFQKILDLSLGSSTQSSQNTDGQTSES